jgi:hypothetical protein
MMMTIGVQRKKSPHPRLKLDRHSRQFLDRQELQASQHLKATNGSAKKRAGLQMNPTSGASRPKTSSH